LFAFNDILTEIQIEQDRSISVIELAADQDGNEEWITSNRKLHSSLPSSLCRALSSSEKLPIKKSYQLQAVISFVRGKTRTHDDYHVVHVKAPQEIEKRTLKRQLSKLDECISTKEEKSGETEQLNLVGDVSLSVMKLRRELVLKKLSSIEENTKDGKTSTDDWLLINGLKVTKTSADDARSFCGTLKEPSIVIFREIDKKAKVDESLEANVEVPVDVMDTVSLSNGCGPLCGSSTGKPSKSMFFFAHRLNANNFLCLLSTHRFAWEGGSGCLGL
jgi:hypothetical protein